MKLAYRNVLPCREPIKDCAIHLDLSPCLKMIHRRRRARTVRKHRNSLSCHLLLWDGAKQRVQVDEDRCGVGRPDTLRQTCSWATLPFVPACTVPMGILVILVSGLDKKCRGCSIGDCYSCNCNVQLLSLFETKLRAGACLVDLQRLHERSLAQIRGCAVVDKVVDLVHDVAGLRFLFFNPRCGNIPSNGTSNRK